MMRLFMGAGAGSWIRVMEHAILRIVSLAFSLASAYAIRVFFEPLDAADPGEKIITWIVAAGFGVLGYVVSRGLVHRMMNKESVWAYAPICFLVELVDISCNYVLAASVVREAWWLKAVPENQRGVLTIITYVVLSAIPLVSLFLAVVDMDLERSKAGGRPAIQTGKPPTQFRPVTPTKPAPAPAAGGATASATPAGAARRAQFWNKQQGQQSAGKSMSFDPEKELVGAGEM